MPRSLLVGLLLFSGCVLVEEEPERLGDGAGCKEDTECRSGVCTSAELCAHSTCECGGTTCGANGKPARQCADDWVCTDADSIFDGVQEFFGGTPRKDKGYCQPLCEPGCPEHYQCSGTLCIPELEWNEPVPRVTWSGAASGMLEGKSAMTNVPLEIGKTVTLKGSATSPSGRAIETFSWMVAGGVGETFEGTEIEVTLGPTDSYRRAELYVTDDNTRTSIITVIFEGCLGQGETCGYEGSGCCQSCDRDANTCL